MFHAMGRCDVPVAARVKPEPGREPRGAAPEHERPSPRQSRDVPEASLSVLPGRAEDPLARRARVDPFGGGLRLRDPLLQDGPLGGQGPEPDLPRRVPRDYLTRVMLLYQEVDLRRMPSHEVVAPGLGEGQRAEPDLAALRVEPASSMRPNEAPGSPESLSIDTAQVTRLAIRQTPGPQPHDVGLSGPVQ